MTREKLDKIAKRYAQDELKDNHGQVEDVVAAAFLNGIDYAEQHPGWISVKDAMPPRDEDHPAESILVLVYNPTSEDKVGLDWYVYDDVDFIGWYSCDEGITHWMPLPTPPEHFANVSKKKGGEQ